MRAAIAVVEMVLSEADLWAISDAAGTKHSKAGWERADAWAQLNSRFSKWTLKEIAVRAKVSESYVSRCISVSKLDHDQDWAFAYDSVVGRRPANYSSESVEWYTPSVYVEAARKCLGGIDLDPASNAQANDTVRAEAFLTDGLGVEWRGRVFLNPPYGLTSERESMAAAFCNKAIFEYNAGHLPAAVILVNSVHSQKWQEPLYEYPVCFVNHRIEFVSGEGNKNENPTFQNIFVYLGSNVSAFVDAFSQFGYVMGPLK